MLADRYDLDYIDGGDARTLTRVIGRKGSSAPAAASATSSSGSRLRRRRRAS